MRSIVMACVTCVALPGCIPFIGEGSPAPEIPSGYYGQILTQRPPQEVAGCIAHALNVSSNGAADGSYTVVSTDPSSPASYTIDVLDAHKYRQTRVLIKGELQDKQQAEQVLNCASAPYLAHR